MRKNIFAMACAVSAVALLAFTSCNKEEVAQDGEFTATIESAAKTAININATGDGVMTWNQNDQIAIFSTNPTTSVTYYAENSGATSTFRRVNGEDEVPDGDNYYAVYPAGIATSANNVVTLSPTQTYSASAFEAPMYAQSESHDLPFKNLCAVLHLVVSDAVSSVAVNTPNQACTGSYTVTWNDGEPTGSITANGGNTVTLSGIPSTARDLYIYLPPQTYTAMTITIVPANGATTIVKTLNQNFTMARNTYYTVNITVPPAGAISSTAYPQKAYELGHSL